MKIVKEFGLLGVGDFKKSVLKIEPGVTYLYGKNMLDGGNGNAAGKSLMASSPSDIFYDTPLVGTRQDKLKAGTRYIKYTEGSTTSVVKSSFTKGKEQLSFKVNGEERKGRTIPMTRELIRKAWAISEEDYRTYGYLDSTTPHPLVRGSTVERKAFFTSFFQLDLLDAEKKILALRMTELKKLRAAHTELHRTFAEVKKDMLSREQRIDLELKASRLSEKVERLRGQAEEAQRVKRLQEFEAYVGFRFKAFRALVSDLADYDRVVKEKKRELRTALETQEQLDEYKAYQRDMVKYREAIEGLDMSVSLEDLEKAHKRFIRAEADLPDYKEIAPPEEPKRVKKPETEKDELLGQKVRYEHQLAHIKKFARGVCGECGQPVETADPEKIRRKLSEVLESLDEWKAYEGYKVKYDRYVAERERIHLRREERAVIEATFKANRPLSDLYRKRVRITKPVKVERPDDVQDVEPLRKAVELLEFFAPHIETVEELDVLKASSKTVEAFDLSELSRLQDRLAEINAKLEVHNTVKGRATKMRDRLQSLDEELATEKALELTLEAYSDKAIKRMAIEAISQRLMETVNRYAAMVFKDYTFEFVWGTQIQILVHRPKGTSDVRKLSGAESKLFTIILVLSLLMFVPKSKRLNLLILDEPSASFSEETVKRFHLLLPHLQQLIPSILVLTPKATERYEGAKEYTVYRDHSGAEIRKGHPSTI